MEGKVEPDYESTVVICTTAAQKELLGLALLAILTPIIVGLVLGVEGLGGFLGGVILSGQLLAVYMSNAGGAWDNAKKLIEDGSYGGKGSESHLSLIHISEPTRLGMISYAVFCLKKKKKNTKNKKISLINETNKKKKNNKKTKL